MLLSENVVLFLCLKQAHSCAAAALKVRDNWDEINFSISPFPGTPLYSPQTASGRGDGLHLPVPPLSQS